VTLAAAHPATALGSRVGGIFYMSIHSALMEQAGSSVLLSVLADEGDGDNPPVVYLPPGGADPVELARVIVGSLRVSDELDEDTGTHQKDEQQQEVELVIPQPFEPHLQAHFEIAMYGEPAFAVREIRSVTASLVTVLVERNLIQRLKQRGQG